MKILIVGDLHARTTRPISRIDDYEKTVLRKIESIIQIGEKHGCFLAIQAGDFFDAPKVSQPFLQSITQLLQNSSMYWYAIYGQHDLFFHNSDTHGTALKMLELAKTVTRLTPTAFTFKHEKEKLVNIYGASWGEEIPKIEIDDNVVNILVTHRLVLKKGELLYPGQEGYENSTNLLAENKAFDLIISGDNHQYFVHKLKSGRALINLGSVLRTTTAQKEHEPCVAIYDTEEKSYTMHKIPVEPFSKVFDEEKIARKKQSEEKVNSLVSELEKGTSFADIDFAKNLKRAMTEFNEEVQSYIMEALADE